MSTLILSIIILPIVGSFAQSILNASYSKKSYSAIISAENILENTKHMLLTKEISYLQENKDNNSTIFELLEIENFETEYQIKDLLYTLKINELVGTEIKNTFVFTDNNITPNQDYPKVNSIEQSYTTEITDIEINFDSVFSVLKGEHFIKEINDKCLISFDNISNNIYMELKVFSELDYSNINITNNSNFNTYINVFDENINSDLSKIKYKGKGILLISKNKQITLKNNYTISVCVYDKKTKNLIKTIGWIL